MIIIQLTPDQLETIIHKAIKNAMFEGPDRGVSPKEAAQISGKSVSTISRMKAKGELTPLHPNGHPRYSLLEIKKNLQ